MRHGDVGGRLDEGAVVGDAGLAGEVPVDAQVQTALTEVAGDGALPLPLVHQGVQVLQVSGEVLGGYGGVLPAGPGLPPVGHAGGDAGAVAPDAPQGVGACGVGEHLPTGAGLPPDAPGPGLGVRRVGALDLAVQPGPSGREQVDALSPARPRAQRVHQGGVHALDGQRTGPRQGGGGRGGVVHVGEAEDQQHPGGGHRHQADGRAEDDAAGALGTDQGAGHVEAPLGQQPVQPVAGDLPAEPPQLGADRGEMSVPQVTQPGVELLVAGGARAHAEQPSVGAQHVDALGDVGGGAPGHGVRTAGVVADHPADGAARVRRRVRADGQPVLGGAGSHGAEHRAGLDGRRTGVRVDLQHLVHVPGEVQHQAGADGVAGDGGAAAARGDPDPVGRGDRHGGGGLLGLGVPGFDDRGRHDPVDRRVGGVGGPGQGVGAGGGQAFGELTQKAVRDAARPCPGRDVRRHCAGRSRRAACRGRRRGGPRRVRSRRRRGRRAGRR